MDLVAGAMRHSGAIFFGAVALSAKRDGTVFGGGDGTGSEKNVGQDKRPRHASALEVASARGLARHRVNYRVPYAWRKSRATRRAGVLLLFFIIKTREATVAKNDTDDFVVRPGPPRARRGAGSSSFVAQVLRSAGSSGKTLLRPARAGGRRGRGHVAARLNGRGLNAASRRVVVKIRLVRHSEASRHTTGKHLGYITREGVGPDGAPSPAYDATGDTPDLGAFKERVAQDRHEFRFIVAPEDGEAIADLRGFTRSLMCHVERDLGTTLDWVAVDHWDTANPHTHIVLRGKAANGRDLVIGREYLSFGMRHCASQLATTWLGPRTELEINAGLVRETKQERWTSLDQNLQVLARRGSVQLERTASDGALQHQGHLRARLQQLTQMGLAERQGVDRWALRPDVEATLRAMGERGDILRTLQREMTDQRQRTSIFDPSRDHQVIVGRIVTAGLADELSERKYLIVDGLDGRMHYAGLPARIDLRELPTGGIVELHSQGAKAIDRDILAATQAGIYRSDHALEIAKAQKLADPEGTVIAHVRRLEALRRYHVVERSSDGVWQIPSDLPERARAVEARRLDGPAITLRSHVAIELQTLARGATWLDQQLLTGNHPDPTTRGFPEAVRTALEKRSEFLVSEGLAQRRGPQLLLAKNLLNTLRNRELTAVAATLQAKTGLTHRAINDGDSVTGTYQRSLQLVSGRFALIGDALGFSLVPWRPVVEKQLGRSITATLHHGHVSFEWGRERGPSR